MCGICGYISKKKIDDVVLEKMNNTLWHRGPDDFGIIQLEMEEDWNLGLGHRRLSILDLSEAGHQPMQDKEGRYTIVFNGEIYNFVELRKELEEKGYSFFSLCDTEVLLNLYIEYGIKCIELLNGMFAFAIYDKVKEEVILARDRAGEKPLYYYWDKKDFVFGSELKPIMNFPEFKKNIRKDVIAQYLTLNAIMPPNTIFENTYKLAAGEYCVWKNGEISKGKYYDIVSKYNVESQNQEYNYLECKKTLKNLLYDSVEKRLIADVPIGCFLSGGIDSTLMSAVANDIKKGINTYCIGFDEDEFDESRFARKTAKHLGTNHHEMIMHEKELLQMLKGLPIYYDEPFADSSQLATMLVAQFAKKDVTVSLSGDGGDEFFAGYTKNDVLGYISTFRKIFNLHKLIPSESASEVLKIIGKEKYNVLFWQDSDEKLYQPEEFMRQMVAKKLLNDYKNESAILSFEGIIDVKDIRIKRMLHDMKSYMPDEVLVKTDRASMKYALEMRTPLLDYRIMDYSYRIPYKYKYKNGEKKYILKDILYDYVPREMLDRPKKGFGVPIRKWLLTTLREQLMRYADAEILKKQGIFNKRGVDWLILEVEKSNTYRYAATLWCFYIFQMWYAEYIEDLWN